MENSKTNNNQSHTLFTDEKPSQTTSQPSQDDSNGSTMNNEMPHNTYYHKLVDALKTSSDEFAKNNPFYRNEVLLRDFAAEWITEAILQEITNVIGQNYRDVMPDRVHPRTRNEINNNWSFIMSKKSNLYLRGIAGAGKTSILAILSKRLLFKGAKIDKSYINTVKHMGQDTGYAVSLPFSLTYCTWGELRKQSLADESNNTAAGMWLTRMSSPTIPVLLLDDVNFGAAHSDWTIRHVADFLDVCRRNKKQVLWTSNMMPNQWQEARQRCVDWDRIWTRLTDNNCVSVEVLKHS